MRAGPRPINYAAHRFPNITGRKAEGNYPCIRTAADWRGSTAGAQGTVTSDAIINFNVSADGKFVAPAYPNRIFPLYHHLILPVNIIGVTVDGMDWQTNAVYDNLLSQFILQPLPSPDADDRYKSQLLKMPDGDQPG